MSSLHDETWGNFTFKIHRQHLEIWPPMPEAKSLNETYPHRWLFVFAHAYFISSHTWSLCIHSSTSLTFSRFSPVEKTNISHTCTNMVKFLKKQNPTYTENHCITPNWIRNRDLKDYRCEPIPYRVCHMGFSLKIVTTTYHRIHRNIRENPQLGGTARLQKLYTGVYNHQWVRPIVSHLMHER